MGLYVLVAIDVDLLSEVAVSCDDFFAHAEVLFCVAVSVVALDAVVVFVACVVPWMGFEQAKKSMGVLLVVGIVGVRW